MDMKRLIGWTFVILLLAFPCLQVSAAMAADANRGNQAQLPDPPAGIDAGAYILMEMETGRVLSGRNIHQRLAMASTTKIMPRTRLLPPLMANLAPQ